MVDVVCSNFDCRGLAGRRHERGVSLRVGCLERRLGRQLTRADFIDAPINDPDDPWNTSRLRRYGGLKLGAQIISKKDSAFIIEIALAPRPPARSRVDNFSSRRRATRFAKNGRRVASRAVRAPQPSFVIEGSRPVCGQQRSMFYKYLPASGQ